MFVLLLVAIISVLILVWYYQSRRKFVEQHENVVKPLKIKLARKGKLLPTKHEQNNHDLLQSKLDIIKVQVAWLNAQEEIV